jgi:amino acid transporter
MLSSRSYLSSFSVRRPHAYHTGIERAHPSAPRCTLTLLPLAAATFFMVAGGPYGLEEIVQKTGYRMAALILLLVPIFWSAPAALLVAELGSEYPDEGGYYRWVARAMGPFWGFQEAWLSLAASVFDMAIYPTLFVLYARQIFPGARGALTGFALGVAVVAACALWNLAGARTVGDSSLLFTALILAPFAGFCLIAFLGPHPVSTAVPRPAGGDFLGGVLIAMWNYMGWDNASTVAGEVERPRRTYPLAMLLAVLFITATYELPVLAAARASIDPSTWTTGSWAQAGSLLGGKALCVAIVAGGALCGVGMFNALVLSYSRVPAAMAEDGFLPGILARRNPRTGVPTFSVLVCAACWSACLLLGFDRLIELDVLLYGSSLLLEFVALGILRRRRAAPPGAFRLPGGASGAAAMAAGPAALLAIALVKNRTETVGPLNSLLLGIGLMALGPALYALRRLSRKPSR